MFLPSGAAQNPATKTQPKAPPPKGATVDPKIDPFKHEPTQKTIKLELHKGSTPDVAAAVLLINEKLEDGWKNNKITPSTPGRPTTSSSAGHARHHRPHRQAAKKSTQFLQGSGRRRGARC